MQLKVDENGHAVLQDGKPVYVRDDGSETAFDADHAIKQIRKLSDERDTLRGKASAFEGLDPEAARKAVETVKNLSDKKLIEAGEVQKVIDERLSEASKAYESKLTERDSQIRKLMVTSRFATSSAVKRTTLPPDIAERVFGEAFKVEGDRVVGYLNGQPILSKEKYGEPADFDEALSVIVDAYPGKESILRGTGNSGGGATGGLAVNGGSIDTTANLSPDAKIAKHFERGASGAR